MYVKKKEQTHISAKENKTQTFHEEFQNVMEISCLFLSNISIVDERITIVH